MSISFDEFLIALDAKRCGEQWTARCPALAHDDDTPSLSIALGDVVPVVLYCFAGCPFEAITEPLTARGIWPVEVDQPKPRAVGARDDRPALDLPPGLLEFNAKLIGPKNHAVDRYLWSRGIDVADLGDVMQHPKAWHKPSLTWWPCMVAGIRDANGWLRSVHRTWLHHIHPGKAPIKPNRMLYRGGECAGCAIRLAPAAPEMLLAEGIETTASAMKIFDLPGWAAGGAGFMPSMQLPDLVRSVLICADNDPEGTGERMAIAAAQRFKREGRQVRIVKPGTCKDYNDLLLLRRGSPEPTGYQAAGGERR